MVKTAQTTPGAGIKAATVTEATVGINYQTKKSF
jgi:hypothetical protein